MGQSGLTQSAMETKQKSIRENFKEVFLSFQITGKTNMEQGP